MNDLTSKSKQNLAEGNDDEVTISFSDIYTAVILNWKWFLLSIVICCGLALVYLRYATPVYESTAKLLVKDENNSKRSGSSALSALESMSNIGLISNNFGVENEIEILTSSTIAEETVIDLKLYVEYYIQGVVKKSLIYKTQPINVDMDEEALAALNEPVELRITRKAGGYVIKGKYYIPETEITSTGPYDIEKNVTSIPVTIPTRVGNIYLTNNGNYKLEDGKTLVVYINRPLNTAFAYVKKLTVEQTSKTSSVFSMSLEDQSITRGIDYLWQLAISYNKQANDDKNELAVSTEKFINERLEKINSELGSTDDALESYKRLNNLMELQLNASATSAKTTAYETKLTDAETQISLINNLIQFANRPGNKHQVLPSNVGLQDAASTSLINEYNKIALERNRLLRTASENSPVVSELTAQLDDMQYSIQQALQQARRNLEIERDAVKRQLTQYAGYVTQMPEQERILPQIGRQQEVKAGLYLMLLEKREENSISLAATADKGKLIENPQFKQKVSPKGAIIMLVALILGILIPSGIIFLVNFMRYRIEGHDDVAQLTDLPIVADIVTANEAAKTKADIVVHENKNTHMEEIFRSMRTNIQFMLKEGKNVILFTSSTSGEGKTFAAANLAVSFALLGKKVVLVGLDVRKPRLAELFEIKDHHTGITNLLANTDPQLADVKSQIMPSGVHNNLDLLMAGPIPPNPAELVARPALGQVITLLRENYDYVIIDTAPVGLVTDTLSIAQHVDITVFMCRADYTTKASFGMINALADEGKLPNVCVAINGIDLSLKKYGYYYGYGKYGKYSHYGYGKYGKYGKYGSYGSYGSYGNYANSHYGNKDDNSVKTK